MGMPNNLVLVRHGESEGNVAAALSKKGDDSMFTEGFLSRHSSTWRLTEHGRRQPVLAGRWIRKHVGKKFHRFFVSEYDRAKETAALLNIPHAEWLVSFYLRERDWGELDVMSGEERRKRFAENLRRKEIDPFYWKPVNGESMPGVCLRLEKVLDTLHRECDQKNAILVAHGEVMWCFRYLLERMSHSNIMELEHSKNPHDKIHNCQIIHYTRIDPVSGEVAPYLNWMRSVCPYELSLSHNEWVRIERKKYSNVELMEEVERRFRHRGL